MNEYMGAMAGAIAFVFFGAYVRFSPMTISNFLLFLQNSKKELQKPDPLTFEQRIKACQKMADLFRDSKEALQEQDPFSVSFSQDFYHQQILEKSARAFERAEQLLSYEGTGFPAGVVGIAIDSPFFLRLLSERVAAAMALGCPVLLKVNEKHQKAADHFRELLLKAGFAPFSLQVISDSEEIRNLFYQHPGIAALSCFDPRFSAEDFGPNGLDKKWQIHRGGKCTALVLADSSLPEAVRGILRSVREGWGQSSWNISRVFVVESIEKEFRAELLNQVSQLPAAQDGIWSKAQEQWLQQLKSEQARPLSDKPIIILENVSNCSEAHQIELVSPFIFLMSVKYAHEMQKWVNNLPNALGVQIWGSREKASRLAEKLETGRVWYQSWIEGDETLAYGIKSSIFGERTEGGFGGFFWERRLFDEAVKKRSLQ